MTAEGSPGSRREVVVGGVGQLYQGDLDLGRRAVERLAGEDLGEEVHLEDFHYGAVAVAQRLEELRPGVLILVGAEQRGEPAGTVCRRRLGVPRRSPAELQAAVAEAVTGYVGIDLVVEVAHALGTLPPATVTIEVEPARLGPSEELSPVAAAALERALGLVRDEVARVARSRPLPC